MVKYVQTPFRVGDRVRVRFGIESPPCRVGTVLTVNPDRQSCLIKHDETIYLGKIGTNWGIFGWGWDDLEHEMVN
jgi:hypothetical protein